MSELELIEPLIAYQICFSMLLCISKAFITIDSIEVGTLHVKIVTSDIMWPSKGQIIFASARGLRCLLKELIGFVESLINTGKVTVYCTYSKY